MSAPLVSVLVPAYNAGSTLAAALQSLRRQSFTDFECLVVDDGSTDATRVIAESFASGDLRFRCLAISHVGLVRALNAGLETLRGRYVARFDADDVAHRHRLERQVRRLEGDADLAAVGTHVRFFPRHQMSDGLRAYEAWLNSLRDTEDLRRDAFVECPIAHPTLMIRRALLCAYRYQDRGWPEDYDLVLRLLGDGHRLGMVAERLHLWRDGPHRFSRTDPSYALDRFTACKAHFIANGFLGRGTHYTLWGYGHTGRSLARALREHGKQPSLMVEVHQGRIGNRIMQAPVVSVETFLAQGHDPLLVSVAGIGPRSEIRALLVECGYVEGRDFICAA